VRKGHRSEVERDNSQYLLMPGFIYLNKGNSVIQAVLGTCVSVCLWDKKRRFGGMNNFLYPFTDDKHKATAKYGNVATITLIRMMEEAGCSKRDIIAQLFGGSSPEGEENSERRNIGRENINVARKVLRSKGIKIVSEDIGGHTGRKIAFDVATGNVAVLRVMDIRDSDWHFDEP